MFLYYLQRFCKKDTLFVLKDLSENCSTHTKAVKDSEELKALVISFKKLDPFIKEAAALVHGFFSK